MPGPIRALILALTVVAALFAGALYFAHAGFNATQSGITLGSDRLATLDLHFFGSRIPDNELLGLAFRQVERAYYKQVDPQTLIRGERNGLLAYLKDALKKRRVRPELPPVSAGVGEAQAVAVLDRQLAYAQMHYSRLGISSGDLTEHALSGMLNSLGDPYTVYLSPQQITTLNEELNGGDFGGVGVFIYQLKDGRVILQPIPDLPAARAGMRGGEVVQRIDGQPIHGYSLDRIEHMIRGPEGTQVTLETHDYKGSAAHEYRITREIIHVPTVHAKVEGGYDYIRLTDFGQTSAAEMRKALLAGKARGVKGYILDLRDNGGGLLDAAVNISSYFVPRGPIVTEIDRVGNRDVKNATGAYISGLRPLVVLVNGFTASASEITAGALADYKLARLIGTRTFGKGVVQGIFTMPNGGALKITTERYVTPAGRDIQHRGITPDLTVLQNQNVNLIDTPADRQLQAAKTFLNRLTR